MSTERSEKYNENNLIWMDLEMTGLQPEVDRVIEIAAVITDSELNVIAEGPVIAVHQTKATLAKMDAWNTTTHTHSGLVARVEKSEIDEKEATKQLLRFFEQYVPAGKSPLCGNSIGQDRRFMARWMPELETYFHYRNVDVSSIKELVRRWSPCTLKHYQKSSRHEALSDIYDSIEELKFYRQNVMKI